MTTKNMLGGALINYGDALPAVGTSPDGALFLKTSGVDAGLYIYRLIADTNPGAIGFQVGAGWNSIVSTVSGGINADTLDGFDSSYFQPADADLAGLAAMSSTGIVVRTGGGAFATRSISGTSLLSVANADGVGGNISLDVNQANLSLNSIGGTLLPSKGGTGITSSPPAGSISYGNGSTYALSAVGSAGQLLQSGGSGAPSWINPSLLAVASATQASTSYQADNSTQLGGLVGDYAANPNTIAARDAAADISVRLIRQNFPNESSVSGGMVFRVNNSTDNYLRVCSDTSSIRAFLDVPQRNGSGASGTWGINITGSAASATSAVTANTANSATTATTANTANALTTAQGFNVTGPSATPSLLSTEGSVSFNGTSSVTLRINGVDASLLTAGTVPNGRINGNYSGFGSITGTGTASFSNITTATVTMASTNATILRNTNTGELTIGGSTVGGDGASIQVWGSGGGTANLGRLRVTGATVAEWSSGLFRVTGNIEATGNVTAFAPSDARLKSEVSPIANPLAKVQAMRGCTYTMDSTGRREVGLIAQELMEVVPEAVRLGSEGFYGVQYGHLVGVLVEAIKEQQKQIEALQQQVSRLVD